MPGSGAPTDHFRPPICGAFGAVLASVGSGRDRPIRGQAANCLDVLRRRWGTPVGRRNVKGRTSNFAFAISGSIGTAPSLSVGVGSEDATRGGGRGARRR